MEGIRYTKRELDVIVNCFLDIVLKQDIEHYQGKKSFYDMCNQRFFYHLNPIKYNDGRKMEKEEMDIIWNEYQYSIHEYYRQFPELKERTVMLRSESDIDVDKFHLFHKAYQRRFKLEKIQSKLNPLSKR